MMALLAANSQDDDTEDFGSPLVRAMALLAASVVRHIVVRAPIIAILHESKRETDEGTVHEVLARTGVLVRAPFALLRRPRFPAERTGADPTDDPAARRA